jgi:CspA family cold shock protein
VKDKDKEIGCVKFFIPQKGYGFITMDDGREVFFHISNVDVDYLHPDEEVEFDLAEGPKGLQAQNVVKL